LETKGALQEDYRVRALGTGAVVVMLALLLLPLIANRTPLLWAHLSRPSSIPPMLTGGILAVLSALAVFKRSYPLARLLAILEVIILIWGWAFAQWPYLIYPDVTLYNAIAPMPTIRFLLGALPFGFALLIPSLWYLFRVFKSAEQ
jgi:cytochrome d ubiquinol oxidase subunit II